MLVSIALTAAAVCMARTYTKRGTEQLFGGKLCQEYL